jgi:hypothetical protein
MSLSPQRANRPSATDEQVKDFIRRQLAAGTKPIKTKLLQALRESGIGCEQSRFGRLYEEVRNA